MILALWLSAALAATPDEIVAAALARDPALAAAEADVRTADGERRAATGLRYNPTAEARLGFGVSQHEVSVSQPISVTGEGIAAANAARAALTAAVAARDRRRLEVAANARKLAIDTIRAEAALVRAREVLALTTALRSAAEQRLAVGEAGELDVHLARLEEAAAAADRLAATRDALAAREELAARTGLPADTALPDDPLALAPAAATPGPRADHAAAEARVESAQSALARERSAVLPPVGVGAWAQLQPQGWTVGPTLAVTLPVWSANRGGTARAAGERDVAVTELAAVDARIVAEATGAADRRAAIADVGATLPPAEEARAALAGISAAVGAGELGAADGALLRARVLDAWGRGAYARAEAAILTVDLALAESWATLLPAAP